MNADAHNGSNNATSHNTTGTSNPTNDCPAGTTTPSARPNPPAATYKPATAAVIKGTLNIGKIAKNTPNNFPLKYCFGVKGVVKSKSNVPSSRSRLIAVDDVLIAINVTIVNSVSTVASSASWNA